MSSSKRPATGSRRGKSGARWPAVTAYLATAALYLALPPRLTAGPRWLLLAITILMLGLTIAARYAGRSKAQYIIGLVLSGVVTLAMVWSLGMLVSGMPDKRESPEELLRAALALWLTNILVFASWYWRLDAGGPNEREVREYHTVGDFLFPQMNLPEKLVPYYAGWKPDFIDYLFLAYNTSTAFSPTDTPVMSRWAKILTMLQSGISLTTLAVLVARAIGSL